MPSSSLTVKELISKKDYDRISFYYTLPEKMGGGSTFFGVARSENGNLISVDGDYYDEDDEILEYKEWSNEEENIKNGITIVVEGNFKTLAELEEEEE